MQQVVNNMPLPPSKRKGAKSKYPWDQMQPGSAFKFDDGVTLSGASSLAYHTANARNMKFAVRKTDDGIWCWRIDGTQYDVANGNYATTPLVENYGDTAKPAIETDVVGGVR